MADNFIRQIIDEDLAKGKNNSKVITRFPPEPNGYLHIGHAKSICLNFGLARDYNGKCNLRMDDTNPAKEDVEYVDSIIEDVHWLGFDWEDRLFYASDYFDKIYQFAVELIKLGRAYVCDLCPDEIRKYRGSLTETGKNSPYRDRSVAENLALFERMRSGEFGEGACTLRAKIDMSSPNINMRDPAIYRIKKADHHRTGSRWCIYPMYDFAHALSDALESITHSICTLEFEDHRPLYDWCVDQLAHLLPSRPRQIEFARLNLTYTVMSKRKLLQLVQEKIVAGWDDPRMPTIAGMRRRGYTPSSIREFCDRIGVAKRDSTVDLALLEFCIREELNRSAHRVMAVLNPLKVVILNYPSDQVEEIDGPYMPEDFSFGSRKLPFAREIYIEREDFMENPPKGFFRLAPGKEFRLRYAYYIKCENVIKDESTGEIREIHCTYDPDSKGGTTADGRKVKGTGHWVSANHAVTAEVRILENLFTVENPGAADDFLSTINPNSLRVVKAYLEPSLATAHAGDRVQFERLGYFFVDPIDNSNGKLIFNRIVTLKDTWEKMQKKEKDTP